MANIEVSAKGAFRNFDKPIRILVMGGISVGKTTLIRQFVTEDTEIEFQDSEVVDDYFTRDIRNCGEDVSVHIVDTNGELDYPQMMKLAILACDIFLLVFAVDDMISFDKLYGLRDMIMKAKKSNKKVSMMVVGNKIDLEPTRGVQTRRLVEKIATVDWGLTYEEVSTRDKNAVDKIFAEAVQRHVSVDTNIMPCDQRRMTSPSEMMHKLRRKLTLRKQKSVL